MKNDKIEIKDIELEAVNGGSFDYVILNPSRRRSVGTVVLHNMPEVNTDKKYIIGIAPTADDIISELRS